MTLLTEQDSRLGRAQYCDAPGARVRGSYAQRPYCRGTFRGRDTGGNCCSRSPAGPIRTPTVTGAQSHAPSRLLLLSMDARNCGGPAGGTAHRGPRAPANDPAEACTAHSSSRGTLVRQRQCRPCALRVVTCRPREERSPHPAVVASL
jgi:hypothetical protein